MPHQTRFKSVEIGIKTDLDCEAFAQWFQNQDKLVQKLPWHTHRWYVYVDFTPCTDADTTIQMLCQMLNDLPEPIRKQWDEAGQREFFIGYEDITTKPGDDMASCEATCNKAHLSAETIAMAARVNAGVRIAIYHLPESAEDELPGSCE